MNRKQYSDNAQMFVDLLGKGESGLVKISTAKKPSNGFFARIKAAFPGYIAMSPEYNKDKMTWDTAFLSTLLNTAIEEAKEQGIVAISATAIGGQQ